MEVERYDTGRCGACDKKYKTSVSPTKGYISGKELALCSKCSMFVNTKALVKLLGRSSEWVAADYVARTSEEGPTEKAIDSDMVGG